MTFYEHAMVGVNGALALGLHRRYGWQIVALAACESILPDWDGLTICLGAGCYAEAHRVWGHNMLVAGLLAVVTAFVFWRFDLITRLQATLARRSTLFRVDESVAAKPDRSWRTGFVWILVAVVAAYLHLLADFLFSIGRGLPVWEVPLLWPFSDRGFAYPMVPWGDVGSTLILVAGMFAMVRWRRRLQPIAIATLLILAAYVVVRSWFL